MTRLQQRLLERVPRECVQSWRDLHNTLHELVRRRQHLHRRAVYVLSLYADALRAGRPDDARAVRWSRFVRALAALVPMFAHAPQTVLLREIVAENADLLVSDQFFEGVLENLRRLPLKDDGLVSAHGFAQIQ